MTRALFAATLFAATSFAIPVLAQELPGSPDASKVAAGTYQADSAHTQVVFSVNHFGFNVYNGLIGGATGTLTLDPKAPDQASVQIEIPISGIVTTSNDLTAHLQRDDFFDAAKFPTATFKSTAIEVEGEEARITGDLTIRGVTKSVTLDAAFTGAGSNPMSKAETVGFEAGTVIKRSEFGMNSFLPAVGDEVYLDITAAFEKK